MLREVLPIGSAACSTDSCGPALPIFSTESAGRVVGSSVETEPADLLDGDSCSDCLVSCGVGVEIESGVSCCG